MADPRHPARTGAPRPPLWTRQFVLVGVTYFFVAMIFYSLITAMAAYAALRFGADDAQAGLVLHGHDHRGGGRAGPRVLAGGGPRA